MEKKEILEKIDVTIFGDDIYHGYTDDTTWNGFICPYFTKEEAFRFMEDTVKEFPESRIIFNEKNNTFYERDSENCPDEYSYIDTYICANYTKEELEEMDEEKEKEAKEKAKEDYKNKIENFFEEWFILVGKFVGEKETIDGPLELYNFGGYIVWERSYK
jgi:hypothetical protein